LGHEWIESKRAELAHFAALHFEVNGVDGRNHGCEKQKAQLFYISPI